MKMEEDMPLSLFWKKVHKPGGGMVFFFLKKSVLQMHVRFVVLSINQHMLCDY